MTNLIHNLINSLKMNLPAKSETREPVPSKVLHRHVKYQFHLPGFNNFHLLPFDSKFRGTLNSFKPYWNKQGIQQHFSVKLFR